MFSKEEKKVVSEAFSLEKTTAPAPSWWENILRKNRRIFASPGWGNSSGIAGGLRGEEEKNSFTSETRSADRVRQQDQGKSTEHQRQRGLLRQHDLNSEPLKKLKQHLESRMGANLEATTVEQHIRSLAKLLFYVNPVCCSLSSIFEAENIAKYLEEMKACFRAKVDACVQALKFMQNCEEHYSADKTGRTMAMFDRFKSRLRKEERRQENLRTDEEGRMEVDGSTIDERISNPVLSPLDKDSDEWQALKEEHDDACLRNHAGKVFSFWPFSSSFSSFSLTVFFHFELCMQNNLTIVNSGV